MEINFIKKIHIGNSKLEEVLTQKIGDGTKDVCIDVTDYLKELDDNNDFKLGNIDAEGTKAVRKLGVVYLNSATKNFIDRIDILNRIIPSFNYSVEKGVKVSTLKYITIYNQFELRVEINGAEKKINYLHLCRSFIIHKKRLKDTSFFMFKN